MAEITLTMDNFEEEVINSDMPVLVDFWAEWCGPCKMLGPEIEELAHDYEGKIKVGKVNVDEQQELAKQFKIMSIPSVMLFINGQVVESSLGYKPKDEFEDMINKYV